MNVLVIGSGGREHAMAQKISESPLLTKLFIAPGNPGTARLGENVYLDITNFGAIGRFVKENAVEMVIVGPEEPLVMGLGNYFKNNSELIGVAFVGPCSDGALLEGSKDFAKHFMKKNGIPTARYITVTGNTINEGYAFLDFLTAPYVLKADGLAAGKGVIILSDLNATKKALKDMLNGQFGAASKTVVIEEFLAGIELSVFVLTDGNNYVVLPEAKDYKRIGEGDVGLNTGGMGAISPVPFADKNFLEKVERKIIQPTILGLNREHISYNGFLFFGLINVANEPFVIEYNVRMGDPESEVVFPRIVGDILPALYDSAMGNLKPNAIGSSPHCACTVMAVSGGYPEVYEKGLKIEGLDKKLINGFIFQAGTTFGQNGEVVTNGGRVISATGLGNSLNDAALNAYHNLSTISFKNMYFRNDIGYEFLDKKGSL
jgi:phosphoribosylamine--glycine ligase